MAKPSITKRNTKAAALTYSELDTNFQNLADATLTLRAGTGGTNVTADLNGTITLVAGTGVTLTGDNSAKTITITNASLGSNAFGKIVIAGQSDVDADATGDTLTLVAGSNITLTTNASTDTVTIAAAGSTNATTVTITDNSTTNTNYNLIFADSSGNLRKDSGLVYNPSTQAIDAGTLLNIATGSSAITVSSNGANQFSAAGYPLNLGGTLVRIQNGPLVLSNYQDPTSISSPENGMIVYNTTTNKFQGRANGTWVDLH
jgi:hypothetical protein